MCLIKEWPACTSYLFSYPQVLMLGNPKSFKFLGIGFKRFTNLDCDAVTWLPDFGFCMIYSHDCSLNGHMTALWVLNVIFICVIYQRCRKNINCCKHFHFISRVRWAPLPPNQKKVKEKRERKEHKRATYITTDKWHFPGCSLMRNIWKPIAEAANSYATLSVCLSNKIPQLVCHLLLSTP